MKQRHIYFIRPVGQEGPVKIGCSESPTDRLCSLMTGSPMPLEIAATTPGDRPLERQIQAAFADSHHHREWFHASKRLSELIRDLAAGRHINELIVLSSRRDNGVPKIFSDILAIWPSNAEFARDIGIKPSHAQVMKVRDSIPPTYWNGIVKAAARRGVTITLGDLARLCYAVSEARRPTDRRYRQNSAALEHSA